MDMFNRYIMRTSGERQHQARTQSESIVFGILDDLKRQNLLVSLKACFSSEDEINKKMEEIKSTIEKVLAKNKGNLHALTVPAMQAAIDAGFVNVGIQMFEDDEAPNDSGKIVSKEEKFLNCLRLLTEQIVRSGENFG